MRVSSSRIPAEANGPALTLDAHTGQAVSGASIADIYQKVRPAVVEIQVRSSRGSGLGTGVVISDKGEILTNAHVVAGARNVQVKLSDGTTLPGQVLGVQQNDDLAIIKANIPHDKLSVVKIGDSSKLRAGQQVIAIGNPFGLEGSVTQGIVSGLRSGATDGSADAIQIDAAINPGNSGGPLLDTDGNLIGINEALENPTGQNVFVGVGFAIPINTAKADLAQLRGGGNSGSGSSRGGA
jgi:putative serine protease PepD